MNNNLKELKACKVIDSVSKINLKNHLDFVTDKKRLPIFHEMLDQVEVYRMVYKVRKLKVVGYVVIPKKGKKLPCIIHLRGGSRTFGMLQPRSIIRNMVKYALEGYVVISTQYPGVEGGNGNDTWGGPDDLDSIKKLRDILKSLSITDYSRIGIKGHSRGGFMVYMMLREVRWIKVAMIAGAPTDQIVQGRERAGWREHQISLWGRSQKESIKRSPIRWVDELPKKTPILIMHGSADRRVHAAHGVNMVKELLKRSIPNRFILFEGADHGITEYDKEYERQTLEWFNRFLKNDESIPNMKAHGK